MIFSPNSWFLPKTPIPETEAPIPSAKLQAMHPILLDQPETTGE